VHPNLIDSEFWRQAIGDRPMMLASSPVDLDTVKAFRAGVSIKNQVPLDGGELVCIAQY
jgi:hypothetical protein